ncbi:hypothetical protein BT63DRAFT_421635 [Microthyrium microscopicum]|uniref:Calcium permease family membrane transporter n=1 Tax=Microthyrium microscopicum TaxID=703497 RepID=A0A6A6UR09_9PEZI|nr:hypothetical protein BT63DRAFT_421635 [Microthyrium microscopicum]
MADDSRNTRSTPSSRRNSDSSMVQATAGGQTSQSPSLGSSSVLPEPSRRRPAPLTTQTEDYGTIPRQGLQTTLPKKPPAPRRVSSQYPHKGQEFSVDDAEDEIDPATLARAKKLERQAKTATGSIRSQSTLRRRPTAQVPSLARVTSAEEEQEELEPELEQRPMSTVPTVKDDDSDQEELIEQVEEPLENEASEEDDEDEEDDGDLSDAESFTLKDRQEAINETHPFGIRIWKPALYKKNRSVQKTAEDEIHSSPGLNVSRWLILFNYLWTICFGWWLCLVCFACAIICYVTGAISKDAIAYGHLLLGLSGYLFYPFGKFVKLFQEAAYAEEDEGDGRSISEFEQWQSGDIEEGRLIFGPPTMNRSLIGRRRTSVESTDETTSLLGRHRRGESHTPTGQSKTRFFGRGKWNIGRVVFFILFHVIMSPCILIACGLSWFGVFSIPMGKLTWLIWDHVRRHPLALSFHSQNGDVRQPNEAPSVVLVCTYRAVGLKYWKYTIDGTNIFLFNLLGIVGFTIFDYYVLAKVLHGSFIASQGLIFILGLLSVIPLAYFIGQAVASISAQSSMGVGATVNAFFSTIVEVFLYCVALKEGKAQLVEGSIIGSIFAGILFLPGISMCFGALKRKTQRFNVKSAGVTSTMMLFAMIGAFGPTLFYQIYGSHELRCHDCKNPLPDGRDCRRCFFSQTPAVHDAFWKDAVLPYTWFAATALFLSYVIGLLFTLRTHAAIIWTTELDEKRVAEQSQMTSLVLNASPEALTRTQTGTIVAPNRADIRDTQLYQRILGQSLRQNGVVAPEGSRSPSQPMKSPHIVPPKARDGDVPGLHLERLSDSENRLLTQQMAEMAATAAAVASRDASTRLTRKPSHHPSNHTTHPTQAIERPATTRHTTAAAEIDAALHPDAHGVQAGGHDAPNWSKKKSAIILITATIAYAILAEILVTTVDVVLNNVAIDEKFLGVTLFALVPNTTEFLNAISFAMNGNIALSMEIGSAYVLQVCLLQVPALVFFSATYSRYISIEDTLDYTFTLIFPQWDMVTVILCIFLLSYMYGEGKSNYFKGSILILAYAVVIVGFWFAGFDAHGIARGVRSIDTLAVGDMSTLRGMVSSGKEFDLH